MPLYLNFERKILKIVKVIAVLIVCIMHALAFMLIWQYHIEGNIKNLRFERETLKIVKVTAAYIEFLNSSASLEPACMHVQEKWDRFCTYAQHVYSY